MFTLYTSRLKQTDFDGKYEYFPITGVLVSEGSEKDLIVKSIGPNPFQDRFTLNYFLASDGNVEFKLLNTQTQVIKTEKRQASKGYNEYEFYQEGLQPGTYILHVVHNDKIVSKKLIKQ